MRKIKLSWKCYVCDNVNPINESECDACGAIRNLYAEEVGLSKKKIDELTKELIKLKSTSEFNDTQLFDLRVSIFELNDQIKELEAINLSLRSNIHLKDITSIRLKRENENFISKLSLLDSDILTKDIQIDRLKKDLIRSNQNVKNYESELNSTSTKRNIFLVLLLLSFIGWLVTYLSLLPNKQITPIYTDTITSDSSIHSDSSNSSIDHRKLPVLTYNEYIENGKLDFQQKKYRSALNNLNRAIEMNNDKWEAYDLRKKVKFCLGNYDGCIEDCDKTLTLNPNCSNCYLYRGRAFYKQSDLVRACDEWTKAKNMGDSVASNLVDLYCNECRNCLYKTKLANTTSVFRYLYRTKFNTDDNQIVVQLPPDALLFVLEKSNGNDVYYKVCYNGSIGYINKYLLLEE